MGGEHPGCGVRSGGESVIDIRAYNVVKENFLVCFDYRERGDNPLEGLNTIGFIAIDLREVFKFCF